VGALALALAPGQSPVQVPLNYNFNGIAHAGEAGSPDSPSGFRSISDRALDFTGGVPSDPVFTRFAVVAAPGALDMVHLGNRNTVDNGNWAFDAFVNGNDVGVQPSWLANVDQSGPQTTTLATAIPIGLTSQASILWHVSNGGGSCDVVFGYQSGASRTLSITAPDWFNGGFAGRDSVDRADAGNNLNLQESTVDLSLDAGEQLVSITFANRSNPIGGYGFYGVNVVPGADPSLVNQIALAHNWNGMVHAGEDQQPDAPGGFRSIADRALDLRGGVPADPLLAAFALVDAAGAPDVVMLGNRDTVAAGTLAFDATADGDDVGTQPSWLPSVDLSGPQVTTLASPILLDAASSASFLYQMSHGGGAFDVTFTLNSGSITATLRGSDWTLNGTLPGAAGVDRASAGASMRVDTSTIDLSPLAGYVLTGLTFANRSNPNGSVAVLAANVTGCLACGNPATIAPLGGGVGPTISTPSTGALGCDLEWNVTGATPSTPLGLFAVSLDATSVPLSLVWPACGGTVHVPAPEFVNALVDAAGATSFVFVTPSTPSACGVTLTTQYFELVAGACPVRLGDALSITIGN